jgi:hypothetical protein
MRKCLRLGQRFSFLKILELADQRALFEILSEMAAVYLLEFLNAANNERSRLNGVDFVRMGFEISENDEYFERIPVVTDTITAGVETTVYSSATIMTQQGIEQR